MPIIFLVMPILMKKVSIRNIVDTICFGKKSILSTNTFFRIKWFSIVCFLKLRNFHRFRPLISKTAAVTIAYMLSVHSRLDFVGTSFYGFPIYSIHSL